MIASIVPTVIAVNIATIAHIARVAHPLPIVRIASMQIFAKNAHHVLFARVAKIVSDAGVVNVVIPVLTVGTVNFVVNLKGWKTGNMFSKMNSLQKRSGRKE